MYGNDDRGRRGGRRRGGPPRPPRSHGGSSYGGRGDSYYSSRDSYRNRSKSPVPPSNSEPAAPEKPVILLTKSPHERAKEDAERSTASTPRSASKLPHSSISDSSPRSTPSLGMIIRPSPTNKPTDETRRRTLMTEHTAKQLLHPEPDRCVPFINEALELTDNIQSYLTDRTDFRVIGCMGYHATGKSKIMSHLAGSSNLAFNIGGASLDDAFTRHFTTGIDIYISQDRTIYLDTQPLMSASVFSELYDKESRAASYQYTDMLPSDSSLIVHSLQLASFLLAVCHTVIFVDDCDFDYETISLLRTVEMLKPSTPSSNREENEGDYYPHVVMVHNRCSNEQMTANSQVEIRNIYSHLMSHSRLKFRDGVRNDVGVNKQTNNAVSEEDHLEDVNVFFLPEFNSQERQNDFEQRWIAEVKRLAYKLKFIENESIVHTTITEKTMVQLCTECLGIYA